MVAIKKTIHAHIVSADQKNPTQIGKVFSLLPSDYRGLINLPTINGTEVIGDMKAKELSLRCRRIRNVCPGWTGRGTPLKSPASSL